MIGYLKGKILSSVDGQILIENNGIGFEVTCSNSVFAKLQGKKEGEVFVYTSVREDGISLFGFSDLSEKTMFLKLISISGVGPKMAITILSNVSIQDLAVKIATSDVKGLSKIKGLGKKTAERIILELREKISDVSCENQEEITPSVSLTNDDNDAILALMNLGFTRNECIEAISKAHKENAKNMSELISFALKNMR